MKKILLLLAAAILVCPQLFAYWVVLKDGTRYEAVDKPTVVSGKATIKLKNGQTISVDASAIDVAKSDEVTRLGGGTLIGVELQRAQPQKQQSSLGSQIKLRRPEQQPAAAPAATAPPPVTGPVLGAEVRGL